MCSNECLCHWEQFCYTLAGIKILPLDLQDLDKAFEDKDATENLEDDNGGKNKQ